MSQLTKPSKGVKRSVADPSHSYHSLTPLWKKARAILQGQSNVKAHDELLEAEYKNILLPFSPSMTQAQYDFYRSEAELPGLTTQYAKTLINALLRKKSSLVLPEGLPEDAKEWIENNFTLDGKSLFNFLDAALWEELQTSHCWVYVDRPKVSDEEFDAMSQEERMMIAPYPVIIKAENVINVQTSIHPITRIKSLTRLVTRYMTEEYNPGNPWHPDYIDTVADHHLDSTGQLVIDYYRREGGGNYNEIKILNGTVKQDYKEELAAGAFTKFDTATPTMFGQRLTRIPAWPLNGHHDPIEPMLIPLVDREISLYNKLSRRNHLLYGAATYTPIVKSDMTDEEFGDLVNAGLGSWLKVRKDEDISVLETPTAALADMENSIANTVMMGTRILGSRWKRTIILGDKPLARANLIKSSLITSSVPALDNRITIAILNKARLVAGIIKCFSPSRVKMLLSIPKKDSVSPRPDTGSHPSKTEKVIIIIKPNQKVGIDIPRIEPLIIILVIQPFGYKPA